MKTGEVRLRVRTGIFKGLDADGGRRLGETAKSAASRDGIATYRGVPFRMKFEGPFTTLPGSARKPKLNGEFAAMSRL